MWVGITTVIGSPSPLPNAGPDRAPKFKDLTSDRWAQSLELGKGVLLVGKAASAGVPECRVKVKLVINMIKMVKMVARHRAEVTPLGARGVFRTMNPNGYLYLEGS